MRRAEPWRTCVGCRRVAPRDELVRLVADDGAPAPGEGLPGRGAWLCRDPRCVDAALRRRSLARALRVPPESVEARRGALVRLVEVPQV